MQVFSHKGTLHAIAETSDIESNLKEAARVSGMPISEIDFDRATCKFNNLTKPLLFKGNFLTF